MNPSRLVRRIALTAVVTAAGATALIASTGPAAAVPFSGGCAQVSIIGDRVLLESQSFSRPVGFSVRFQPRSKDVC